MSSAGKRIIFGTLLACFFIYTVMVYTVGTSIDPGEKFITNDAVHGKSLFQKYNCGACHQIYGLGGYMGPDLTNVISRNNQNPQFILAMIENGSDRMPDFQLNKAEVNSIIAYLRYIDQTGVSPVIKFKINYDGTILDEKSEKKKH